MPTARTTGSVLGVHIDALLWDAAMARLLGWARARVALCDDLQRARGGPDVMWIEACMAS